ncbi:hypothetical protein IAG44_41740 [Streptomyces roseirectus]|uniref:Uncharacterized protein n=2 Tax=Streptomyces roseirectus TaxID=2768066 RepID=A0A7H0ITT5_9ACTN|nr:hypothetical protein IAG44_41740 [Streptomyces roseirectus]
MKLSFDGGWRATVTDDPLHLAPRFAGGTVYVAPYTNVTEREHLLATTFGSQEWLWDIPDTLRFDPAGRQLAGLELQMPYRSAAMETSPRCPTLPAVRPGGLRADEVRNFRHEMCSVLCRTPGDATLICLRDMDILSKPLDARLGIAPDVALLIQRDTVVGWTLTNPAHYLTTGFSTPSPTLPSNTTRQLLTECLDLITTPVVDDLVDGHPATLARLRAADASLRAQREDRHRADALLSLIATYVEDWGKG